MTVEISYFVTIAGHPSLHRGRFRNDQETIVRYTAAIQSDKAGNDGPEQHR